MQNYSDYLMIIAPPDDVMYEIDRYKRASAKVIGNFEGMRSPAHISINHQHRCKPFVVHHGLSQMAESMGHISPINLQISNFKYFTHGSQGMTIYACIVVNERNDRWFKALRTSMRLVQKNFVPHITIVKNLPAEKFGRLWPKFEQCKLQCSFKADRLTVLHKETYNERAKWELYKEFRFGTKLADY